MVNTILKFKASSAEKAVMCRLCMNHNEYSLNIFVASAIGGMEMWSVIRDLLNLEVAEGDGLPETVCRQCSRKLMEFSEFKEMCIKSATELKRNPVESYLNVNVNEEVPPNETHIKEETYDGDVNLDEDESQERPVSDAACVPPETGNLVDVKVEPVSSKSLTEEESCRGKNLDNDSSTEKVDEKVEVFPIDAQAEEESYREENLGKDAYWERAASNAINDNEEVASSESLAEDGAYGGQKRRKDELGKRSAYNVVCVPLEVGDQVEFEEEEDQSESHVEEGEDPHEDVSQGNNGSCRPSGEIVKIYSYDIYPIMDSITAQGEGYNLLERNELDPTDSQDIQLRDWAHYICNYCGFRCSDKKMLSIHISGHIIEKNTIICERPKISRDGIPSECEIFHEGIKKFKCETCGKEFPHRYTLVRHRILHTGIKRFECKTCGARFYERSNLKKHSLSHIGLKTFKCEICGKCFALRDTLKAHLFTHSDSKPFSCDICGKGFGLKSHLLRHIQTHNDLKQFKCETCGLEFRWKNNLISHMTLHLGLKPFQCVTCGKMFSGKNNLKLHSVVHSSVKPWKCQMCGKGFKKKNHLVAHRTTHTKPPLKCEICGKEYHRKSFLLKHSVVHRSDRKDCLL